jgi:hypothetical protein
MYNRAVDYCKILLLTPNIKAQGYSSSHHDMGLTDACNTQVTCGSSLMGRSLICGEASDGRKSFLKKYETKCKISSIFPF